MRRTRNIFRQESYRGTGFRSISGVTIALIVCSVLSGLAVIGIIANFGALTARIAIFIANLLSYSVPVLILILVVVCFIVWLRRRLHRGFWER